MPAGFDWFRRTEIKAGIHSGLLHARSSFMLRVAARTFHYGSGGLMSTRACGLTSKLKSCVRPALFSW
jgi:hypothetical protein